MTKRALAIFVTLVTAGPSLSACVAIDGGAVEVGWQLRDANAEAQIRHLNCSETSFDSVRLLLLPIDPSALTEEDPCASTLCVGGDCCLFRCAQESGVTGFVIPPGHYSMAIRATTPEGVVLESNDGITTPAPVVREVRVGEVTALGVNLIIVDSNR